MSKEEKKRKKLGLIISGVTHLFLILMLFAFTFKTDKKEEEPVLLLMDFTPNGSSSRGGSSAAPTESETVTSEPQQVVEPVVTQKTESAVKKSDKKANESSTTNTTTQERQANSQASAAGAFGGDGDGDGNGSGDGNGDGTGLGENDGNGPGLKGFGEIGSGDGSNPEFNNPTQEEGKVLVKLFVNRKGRVTSVEVLSSRRETTTSDAVLLNKAKRDGMKYTFTANSNREEISIAYRLINYTLQ